MKKVLTYIFVTLVSFAYSYEAIDFFSKSHDPNFYCEETGSESEEPTSKNENLKFFDDEDLSNKHLHNWVIFEPIELGRLSSDQHTSFSSSDYSYEVYSPPEAL